MTLAALDQNFHNWTCFKSDFLVYHSIKMFGKSSLNDSHYENCYCGRTRVAHRQHDERILKKRAGVQQRREGCHGYSLGTALPAGMAGRRPDASELFWLSSVWREILLPIAPSHMLSFDETHCCRVWEVSVGQPAALPLWVATEALRWVSVVAGCSSGLSQFTGLHLVVLKVVPGMRNMEAC